MSDISDDDHWRNAYPEHQFTPGREGGGLRQALDERLTGWSISSFGKLWMAESPDREVSIRIEEHRDRLEEWVLEVVRGADVVLRMVVKTGRPFPAAARDAVLVLMAETGLTPAAAPAGP